LVIDKEKILGIAQRYILKGQTKKAIKEYLKLIEASPKDKRLYLKLGDLYSKIGENEKAIQEYLKLADLYADEDLNSRAISVYKKVLSINPEFVEAFHKTAKLYLKEGLVGSAKNYYQSVLELKPDDQDALKALEYIENYRQAKESPKAVSPEEPFVSKHRQPPAKKHIGERTSLTHSPTTATSIPTGETPIPPTTEDAETHYHLGIAYKEMELFDYAISEFELASSNPSMKFDCYIMLGDCFMEKGDYDKSINCYKTASEIKGLPEKKLARLQFNLGLAYEANGMVSEALHAFNLVLKLDHSFSEAQEKIRKLEQPPKS